MNQLLSEIINLKRYPLESETFRQECLSTLNENGALVMRGFLNAETIASIQNDGTKNQHLAYYTTNSHNIYLTENRKHKRPTRSSANEPLI